MGRSSPRSTGCNFTFGDSAMTGTDTASSSANAIVFIGPGIIRYASGMQHKHRTMALLTLMIASLAFAQQPGTITLADDAIPAAQLEKMDRRELGDSWRADIASRLPQAHQL